MAWRVELDPAAARELGKIDPQTARRILAFLRDRVAQLDDPRALAKPQVHPPARQAGRAAA